MIMAPIPSVRSCQKGSPLLGTGAFGIGCVTEICCIPYGILFHISMKLLNKLT